MASITIRKARLSDMPQIMRFEKQLHMDQRSIVLKRSPKLRTYVNRMKSGEGVTSKRFRKWIRSSKAEIFIAEMGIRAVGFATVALEKNDVYSPPSFAFIGYLFVSNRYRRQGVSSQIFAEILAWLTRRKMDHLLITVMADNEHARSIYKNWGFREAGVWLWRV